MKLKNKLIINHLRKFYFKNNWSHSEVQAYLKDHYQIETSRSTLKRWKRKLKNSSWIGPIFPKPPIPSKAISKQNINRIIDFRKKVGWGALTIKHVFKLECSESTIRRLIKSNGLSRGSKIENMRIHWVKWQRDHPDSLWQMDGSKLPDGKWILPIIDDCSRYNIGIRKFKTITTRIVTNFLEELIGFHGKPREILTDNGSEFGGMWKNNSTFDKWCKEQGIKHIRSRIHKPTTAGKVERFHGTHKAEISYCNGDYELFRYRYNQIRPHRSLHMKTPAEVYFSLQIRINGVGFNQSKW
ncbi:MAG: DDE-type integrase/transposase/recombinase [Nanoarchaeota archaeon]|nr:DDE-type integrase/transposase/recombinase [Nanoarchaeota archaeon]MBU1622234.1 DDE-type integrase/transposase/recombinase [Nanoarchaeota archaeon]